MPAEIEPSKQAEIEQAIHAHCFVSGGNDRWMAPLDPNAPRVMWERCRAAPSSQHNDDDIAAILAHGLDRPPICLTTKISIAAGRADEHTFEVGKVFSVSRPTFRCAFSLFGRGDEARSVLISGAGFTFFVAWIE
ncbi:hypothetical protein [Rhizobium leguminosarum]|uniref:hypothetical protein n=1 Tax=Rhizobium leguminosarum TaxID=384 RepID=UPI00102FFFAC|nr:hypothetical protein [Rhizobium leguminosarum]TBF89128.1 hypothetical protein ELG82_36915 [Rhizobium leguminosarum]